MDVSYNALSGTIPAYRNRSSLTALLLYNNQFTGMNQPVNLPNLIYYYVHNNQITGEIPSFTDCPSLQYLLLFNNKFSSYKSGAFADIYKIRYLDVSNNLLTQFSINKIVDDLYTNYEAVKRGGIAINLKGNSVPGVSAMEKIEILRSKGWSIAYD
jgi:Leucine-rich repeat (LRR) protein